MNKKHGLEIANSQTYMVIQSLSNKIRFFSLLFYSLLCSNGFILLGHIGS